jgi:hypothetical protein
MDLQDLKEQADLRDWVGLWVLEDQTIQDPVDPKDLPDLVDQAGR